MTKRISIALILTGAAFALSGCAEPVEAPRIVNRDRRLSPPAPAPTLVNYTPPTAPRQVYTRYPAGWVPALSRERRWKAIVIHHTAKNTGNMALIDEYHRNNNGWDGVGYDFIIGNGKGSRDGQVEVSFRWRKQVAGAHCGGTPNNWANEQAIGVCLIGDFTKTRPTFRQMQSLKKLVRFLQKRYGIPTSRVYGHCNTPGYTRGSVCPGNYFPMASFKRSL